MTGFTKTVSFSIDYALDKKNTFLLKRLNIVIQIPHFPKFPCFRQGNKS